MDERTIAGVYISIGGDMAVRDAAVIGIFDLDNATCSRHTRDFLKRAEDAGSVVAVSNELPKAFVLTREFSMDRVYLTQFSAATIEKRGRRRGARREESAGAARV